MKKVLLTACLCSLLSASVSAQVWIGGELKLRLDNTTLGDFKMDAQNSVEIAPEVGLSLNDRWAVAMKLRYAHYDNAEVKMIGQTVIGNCNQFGIEPFVRYTYYNTGRFSFFADGGVGYGSLAKSDYDDALHSMGLHITPGLLFGISSKVGLSAHLGSVGYEHSWMKDRGMKLKNDRFSLDVFDGISFGAYVLLF